MDVNTNSAKYADNEILTKLVEESKLLMSEILNENHTEQQKMKVVVDILTYLREKRAT